MAPSTLTVTYTSPTTVLLEWTFSGRPPIIDYHCVVYYQSGIGGQNVSFGVKKEQSRYNLTDLPVEVIDVSLVVILNYQVHSVVYLPSGVVGPVTPSVLPPTILIIMVSDYCSLSCSRVSRGGGVRRRIRSDWDLIHTDMQSQSTQWSTRSLSQHPVEET